VNPAWPWAAWSVVLPLGAAVLATIVGRRARPVLLAAAVFAVPFSAAGLAWQVWRLGPQRYAVGGWGAPLGIELRVDGLAALFVCIAAVVCAAIGIYASGFFRSGGPGGPRVPAEVVDDESALTFFWPLWLFGWAALNALFLSGDIFNLYVTLELLSLAAVALVTLGGGRAAPAGMRYMLVSLIGSMLLLLGVALLYGAYGTVSLRVLAPLLQPDAATWLVLAALTTGLAAKTALFPLHGWLPPAHAGAPAPASALLSALVVKGSFYILLRVWLELLPALPPRSAPVVLGLLGAAAVVWGSVMALRQQMLKRLVAYSTVAQLGYLFILFPLLWPPQSGGLEASGTPAWPLSGAVSPAAGGGTALAVAALTAWQGGVYQALAHACAKAAMFLAAGSMVRATRDERIAGLEGIGQCLPLSFTAFGLAGLSLAGLPPTGGFVAKWLLVEASVRSGQWWWAMIIVLGGLLAVGYVYHVLRHAFGSTSSTADSLAAVPRAMELSALALAVAAVLLGLWAAVPLRLLGVPIALADAAGFGTLAFTPPAWS
jgi:multicomponent Na+:H+ antiporter subunit D